MTESIRMALSPFALAPLAGFLVLLAFSGLVGRRRGRGGAHREFALVNLAAAAWNLDIFLQYTLTDPGAALLADRLLQPVMVCIPLAWVNFVSAFLGSRRRRTLLAVFAAVTLPLLLVSPTALFIAGNRRTYFGHYGLAGPVYGLYALAHAGALAVTTVLLAASYRTAREAVRKNQVGYLLAANLLLGFLSADNFLPLYGVERYPVGNIAVILYLGIVAWAILRHRFLDLRAVVRRSLAYSIATFLLTGVYAGLILLLELLVRVYLLPESLFIPLLPAAVVAFLFHGVKERVRERIDDLFGSRGGRAAILSAAAASLPEASGRREVARTYCGAVEEALGPDRLAFFVRVEAGGRWRALRDDGLCGADRAFLLSCALPEAEGWGSGVADFSGGRRTGSPRGNTAREGLRRLGFELAAVLGARGKVSGVCLLGRKEGGGLYTQEDRAFLSALSGHAASALEAREYYERWKSEERFTSLGRASAIISHELRNPFNVIRGAVLLLKKRRSGGSSRFVGIIEDEVRKGTSFIEQFLRASSVPRAARRRIEFCSWLSGFAASWARNNPGPSVRTLVPPPPLEASVDPLLMECVLDNLCRNAAQAMDDAGTIVISLGRDARAPGGGLVLSVSDEGPGLGEREVESVFDPFFTTRPGGTGLGLCLVDGAVRAHGGHVEVESEQGRGAVFKVFLPDPPAQGEGGAG